MKKGAPLERRRPSDRLIGRTRAADIVYHLREDIVSCAFKPGQRLKFEIMQSRYNASFSTIREAMSKLTSEGLILADGQRGFHVAPVSVQDLNDLAESRILLETQALRMSIAWGDTKWEDRIKAAQQRLVQVKIPAGQTRSGNAEWIKCHREFHTALLSACGSPILIELTAILFERAHRYRRLSESMSFKKDKLAEHADMAKACLTRDAGRATALLERHIRQTAENIVTSLTAG